ncbi:1-phosphofructokinase family hexose kinase [Streptacidiphilus anmyonensis]|uniref:1-phosphofructokinase family hexose kinase n=1 Tax=Streptacidiphilus anmyonensis TaxID=405782 RepID=UPI0006940BB0|nr:PfkB family carbohydrate kinase [Streptacidiphilus anmyonensis]
MIVTVTLNAALDVTYVVAGGVRPGATHRVRSVAARAGGKGVNTARVLAALGEPVLALGLAGGASGAELREELDAAGVPHRFTPIAGTTRRTVAVVDATDDGAATGGVTGFWEPGPQVSAAEWTRFLADFRAALPAARAVVLSGSLPPGVPGDAYAELVLLAADAGVPTLLDADAAALREALRAQPTLVKPNAEEALRALGREDRHADPARGIDSEAAAARLTQQPPDVAPAEDRPTDVGTRGEATRAAGRDDESSHAACRQRPVGEGAERNGPAQSAMREAGGPEELRASLARRLVDPGGTQYAARAAAEAAAQAGRSDSRPSPAPPQRRLVGGGVDDSPPPPPEGGRPNVARTGDDEGAPADLARRLVAAGAGAAVVSAGAEGLAAWWGGRLLAAAPPRVVVGNATGAGDAASAALAVALARGLPPEEALRRAVALSAAAVAAPLAGDFDPAVLAELEPLVAVRDAT